MNRQARRAAQLRRRRWLGVAMGLVLVAGFAAGIRAAVANEDTDPDILALMAQLPNDQAPGACDVPKATASPKSSPAESGSAGESGSARPSGAATGSGSAKASARATQSGTTQAPSAPANCAHGDQGGPFASDFVSITKVTTKVREVTPGGNASKGTFVSECGRNQNNHRNSDNFIVAPGVSNGAHHVHDYVGNLSTDGFSTDSSLAAAGTTCKGNDKSAYYWPVLRVRGKAGPDANSPGGGQDGNLGTILRPASVQLEFRGNAKNKVRAMPKFMRMITGDAKAGTNGLTNAKASWTCSGFEGRTTTKYPICPQGSQVIRVLDFPSCWDGRNTDSANHRSHVVFPKNDGSCWQETVPVPQLRMTLAYNVPARAVISLDTFPEQKHNPLTDHGDFTNVMPDPLMKLAVDCINGGRTCDADGLIQAVPSASQPAQTASPSRVPPAEPSTPSRGTIGGTNNGGTNQSGTGNGGGANGGTADSGQQERATGGNAQPAVPPQAPPVDTQAGGAPGTGSTGGDRTGSTGGNGTATGGAGATDNSGSAAGAGTATGSDAGLDNGAGRDNGAGNGTGGTDDQSSTTGREDFVDPSQNAGSTDLAPTGGSTSKAGGLLANTGNRTVLYALNGAALTALGGWLLAAYRRRRLR
jgi:hypothetical protein